MKYLPIMFIIALSSCNWAKEKTKDTVNRTGEVVAKTGAEFLDGVRKGVEKTFQSKVVLADKLKDEGLETGRILIRSSDSTIDNIVSVYFIFNKEYHGKVMVRAVGEDGVEYGRASQQVKGAGGEAKYYDFIFDKRASIDLRSTLMFQ